MATIENVADMLFSGLTSVAMGSYARTPPQAERTQSHRPQRGELLAEPALNVAGSISFRFHVVCVSYNTHTLQGFSSRTVSLSPHTKRQATSTQRQQKNWGWARPKHGHASCVTGGSDPTELWAAESRQKWGRSRPFQSFFH